MRRSHGFTLIELLVCIAIIGVLAGMILGAVSRARYSAQLAQCKNNQRQIGQAVRLYSLAYDGVLVGELPYPTNQICSGAAGASMGLGLLYPQYLSNPRCLFCPTDQLNNPDVEIAKLEASQEEGAGGGDETGDGYCSYVFRQHGVGEGAWRFPRLGVNPDGREVRALSVEVNVPAYGHIVHRGDMVTVLFSDGSVRALTNEEDVWSMTGPDPMAEAARIFCAADAEY